jgi:hypothetical protein
MSAEPGREISMDQLMTLRASTQAISGWLKSELADRLETVRPLLAARRLLGDHIKSAFRESVRDADKNFEKLQEAYRDVSGSPFKLPSRLDSPIEPISTDLALHPWEYGHALEGGKKVALRSPVRWIVSYETPISFEQVRTMLAGESARSEEDLKKFTLSALVMNMMVERNAGLVRLLESLRYTVERTTSSDTGKLPLVTISCPVQSFRPADNAIAAATSLSGVSIFEELVDKESIEGIEDPVRARLLELADGS